jgi:uncharacterized protein (UPF0332 family)
MQLLTSHIIPSESKAIAALVKKQVLLIDNEVSVILFGSRARADAENDSDWDFIVKNKQDYIIYRLQKSAQSIKEARLLMENGLNDTAMSRLYYAAFYAVNALLALHGFNPKTYSGTKSIFNKEFILTGKIESRFSDFYSFLMAKRFEADYDDFVFIDEKRIQSSLEETEEFISKINTLIQFPKS